MSSRPDRQPYGDKPEKGTGGETLEDSRNVPGQGRKPDQPDNLPGQGQQKETDRNKQR